MHLSLYLLVLVRTSSAPWITVISVFNYCEWITVILVTRNYPLVFVKILKIWKIWMVC